MNWISVDDKLPDVLGGLFKVKLQDGREKDAFFYKDAMAWLFWYGIKCCYW